MKLYFDSNQENQIKANRLIIGIKKIIEKENKKENNITH